MRAKSPRTLRISEVRREAFINGVMYGTMSAKAQAINFAVACVRSYAAKEFGSSTASVTRRSVRELIEEIRRAYP